MNILIIGSGGREHSLFETVSKDKTVSDVYMLGTNGAIDKKYLIEGIASDDFPAIRSKIVGLDIELTIIGPEMYLDAGLVDYLRAHNHRVFGPDKYCAKLESSKNFAKEIMAEANIPTAKYKYVTDKEEGLTVCREFGYPIVLKYDGLAAGKGVSVCQTEEEANIYFDDVFGNSKFGDDGVVIEECLVGEEYSVFAIVNNQSYGLLPIAQDFKRAYDGDLGPNTGGMGANTTSKYNNDLPFIKSNIIEPLLERFKERGYKYKGFLYVGLMATVDGPKVIEFNVRMGDPETQIVMQKLNSSLVSAINDVCAEVTPTIEFDDKEYVGVVLASKGYPNSYEKNVTLELNEKMNPIYHMGTKLENDSLVSTGGRVMMVTSSGDSVEAARTSVYQKLDDFDNEKLFSRNDIGENRI